MPETDSLDVAIVGGGVAGRSAGIFTARHGLETAILDAGSSLLRRNAHLENYPGFPAGINARRLLDMMLDQAQRAGCSYLEAEVAEVAPTDDGFAIEASDDRTWTARYVIAATKNAVGYLEGIDGVEIIDRGKRFVDVDRRGRTGVEGLYAAGRLALEPHQTVISAGHGAKVGFTVLEDDGAPFYQDWVAPEGYFTGRDRDVPPGCEEIDEEERLARERTHLEVLREYFADHHPDRPQQHPSVVDAD
ncbi:MAG: FAD-binding protein [Halobacteriota archaeon]